MFLSLAGVEGQEAARSSFQDMKASVKWGWACRRVDPEANLTLLQDASRVPRVGDVAVAEVESINNHTRIITSALGPASLYPGDLLLGVFGNRYATDAFEAEAEELGELHLLTNAGMIGTVRSRHKTVKPPTRLRFIGYLADSAHNPINLKNRHFRPRPFEGPPGGVVLVVGTGMNAGKTTTASRLARRLVDHGRRVAVIKLTGSVCSRDWSEFAATGAHHVSDFSDHGFPSTYLSSSSELEGLFTGLLADAAAMNPHRVIMEIADGVLQRETSILLKSDLVRRHVRGVVVAASCAPSALHACHTLSRTGYRVLAVSGRVTNAPLFVREFQQHSDIPVLDPFRSAGELAQAVDQVTGTAS